MKFDPYEKESLRQLLGDEGVRILNDSSFRGGGGIPDVSQCDNAHLLHAVRGCFIGAAGAWTDIQFMLARADALLQELATRSLPPPSTDSVQNRRTKKGYLWTPEQRAKLSAAKKASWAKRKAALAC